MGFGIIYTFLQKNFGTNNKSRLEQMRNNKYVTLNIREQRLKENCKCGKYNPQSSNCKCQETKKKKRNAHRDFLFGNITSREYDMQLDLNEEEINEELFKRNDNH